MNKKLMRRLRITYAYKRKSQASATFKDVSEWHNTYIQGVDASLSFRVPFLSRSAVPAFAKLLTAGLSEKERRNNAFRWRGEIFDKMRESTKYLDKLFFEFADLFAVTFKKSSIIQYLERKDR